MMNTTRRGFLKVFGFLGALFAGAKTIQTTQQKSSTNPFADLDAEALDVKPLPCSPAINWKEDNKFTHDLAHGRLTWNADGSTLLDANGNEVSRESRGGKGMNYDSWMEHGEDLALERLKNENLTVKEQIARASAWVKPVAKA